MGEKIKIDNERKIVFLYSVKKRQWEDRTMHINAMYEAFYYGNFTGYDIYFKGTQGKLFYKAENVKFLNYLKSIDIEKFDVYANGELVNAIKLHQFEGSYYRVYLVDKIIVTQNVKLKSNKYKDILSYYYDLADYAGTIAEEDSPLYFLAQNYKRIKPARNSILYDFARGECMSIQDSRHLLVPFDFNQSQIQAISNALHHKISIIEGPPGTGKTQTILNLTANLIYRGLNCAIVSNNNTAIDNVFEKLTEENLSFLAAALGRKSKVEEFLSSNQIQETSDFLERGKAEVKTSDGTRITELSGIMKRIQELEVENSILKSQLTDLQNEQRHYDKIFNEDIVINKDLSSNDYLALVRRLEKPKKIRFIKKWLLSIKFKTNIAKYDVNTLLGNAEKLFYIKKLNEITIKIDNNTEYLKKHDKETVNKNLKKLSRAFLENHIYNHYTEVGLKEFDHQSYKKDFADFLLRYPIVLSTSQSLLNNAPKGFTFDYLIIDEASQGDLLSSVLAMNCAKNMVVVGDSRQLQQIDEQRLFSQSEVLANEYDIPKSYRYESNSILMSVKTSVEKTPTTLLREHYRCAPDIINFCNKMFYEGKLIAMTKNNGQHIEIIKTVPGNHARKNPHGSGLYNQREIDEIGNILKVSTCDDIGVITPFRYQADIITQTYKSYRLEADTIHKFQGRQKSEIILSFVVNSLEKNPDNVENRLYDFVTNEKLLNVAISRSKQKVTAIVSDKVFHSSNNVIKDFINYAEYLYGSDVLSESTITSVFDYLYSEYTTILLAEYEKNPKGYKTELIMIALINKILKTYSYIGYSMHTRLGKLVNVPNGFDDEERRYILHPWTHVDFLFYNKVSKEKLFVLEVDGIKYHEQDKKQSLHDDIKNRVLSSNNLPIYRFKTNESNEEQRLNNIIKEFAY